MRPVMLDLHGFASFRDEAHVDFGDADFFALVGPTGSGKSTVIDAMTFALYGSVPRWGRKGMVSLALAPTVARGTVKLVFEVAGQRYVVARELRRTGGTVNQRAASLERLADPRGLARPGDQTVPMAKDLDGVNEAVEKLLGLRYEDFVQCVVLPQGQFAAFLHAKPSERQDILLRLLGAEHYRLMMAKANQRASVAAQRASTYGEELLGYADATPEAEQGARAAEAALASLGERVTAALPLIGARRDELKAADDRLRRLRAEAAALSALRVPDGDRDARRGPRGGRAGLAALKAAERGAEDADGAARAALAAGPARAPLELARAHRAEHARHQAAVPGLAADVARARSALRGGLGRRGHRRRRAWTRRAPTATRRPARPRPPPSGSPRWPPSTPGSRGCPFPPRSPNSTSGARPPPARSPPPRGALEEAERADAAARDARAAAAPEARARPGAPRPRRPADPPGRPRPRAERAAQRAAAARDAADAALSAAEQARLERQAELDEARRAHVVAGLRPHLVAGEPCPVCEQTVATLPAPLPPARSTPPGHAWPRRNARWPPRRPPPARPTAAAIKADADLAAAPPRRTALAGDLTGAPVRPAGRASRCRRARVPAGAAGAAPARRSDEHACWPARSREVSALARRAARPSRRRSAPPTAAQQARAAHRAGAGAARGRPRPS